jgi:hypothetical protein
LLQEERWEEEEHEEHDHTFIFILRIDGLMVRRHINLIVGQLVATKLLYFSSY